MADQRRGKQSVLLQGQFDPTTTTLSQFIDMYIAEGRGEAGRELKGWGTEFNTIPELKAYLDRPVIDVISADFYSGPDSAFNKMLLNTTKGKLDRIKPKFRAIYENVQPNLLNLPEEVRAGLPEIRDLRDSIVKRTAPAVSGVKPTDVEVKAQTFDYRLNPMKLGEFYLAAAEHAKNNPEDAPAIRAFLFNLQTGMRPGEVTNLTDSNIYQARTSYDVIEQARQSSRTWLADIYENAAGRPFLTGYIPKTKTLIDAPLSDHALALIGSQQSYNANLEAKYGKSETFVLKAGDTVLGRTIFMMDTPEGPRPVAPSDITQVLKKIKVPGIIEEVRPDGVAIPRDTFETAYDARRMNATAHKFIDTPLSVAAQLKGRGVKEQGAGREGDYRRLVMGMYPQEHIIAQNKLSDLILGEVEVALRGSAYEGTALYGQPIGSNFIPTDLAYDETGSFVPPPPDEKGPPVRLLDASQGSSAALTSGFREKVTSATPDIEVVSDADYDEIFEQAKDVTPDAEKKPATPVVPEVDEAKTEDIKSRLQSRLDALKKGLPSPGTLKGMAGLGVVGALSGLSYTEGAQAAEEEGLGTTAQVASGVGKTLFDLFETAKMAGAGMGVFSEKLGVDPATGQPVDIPQEMPLGPVETPGTRAMAISQMDRDAAIIAEQKGRISEYDARTEETGSIDDQMNQLQGITPDIEVTYPTNEGIRP